jgi:hypothetical protein
MTIHHWLIPTKKNKFHPHALRPVGLMVFLLLFVTIPFLYNVTSAKQMQVLGYATNVSVGDLYALTNQERAANGLGALALNSQLNSAAVAKANHMFANNYWAHVAPDGTTPWSFIYAAGYNYSVAGENLAKDFNTSSGAVAGWMASPTHRDNILHTSYKDIGFGVVNGVLLGAETTLIVAMYGGVASAPAPAPTPAPVQAAPTPPSAPAPTPAIIEPTPSPTVEQPAAPAPVDDTTVSEPTTTTQTQPTPSANNAAAIEASSDLGGIVEGIAASAPVKAYIGLNWGQKVSILLICTLMLLFIMKHTLIWRASRKGAHHIWLRAHPIGQMTVLTAVLIVTIASGAGTVL